MIFLSETSLLYKGHPLQCEKWKIHLTRMHLSLIEFVDKTRFKHFKCAAHNWWTAYWSYYFTGHNTGILTLLLVEQIWLQIAPLMPHSSYKYSQYTAYKSTNIWQHPGTTWDDTPCCHWILSINSMSPVVYKIIATGSLSTLDLLRTVGTNIKHISITLNLFQGWWLKHLKWKKTNHHIWFEGTKSHGKLEKQKWQLYAPLQLFPRS